MSSIFYDNSDIVYLEDREPPVGSFLCAKYKRSFAYESIKNYLPDILTKTIDFLHKSKEKISSVCGLESLKELENIIKNLGELKYEITTNNQLVPLKIIPNKVDDDAPIWNNEIKKLTEKEGEVKTWFNTKLFIAETYMYRRLAQEFLLSTHLKSYDLFEEQKQEAYFKSINSINYLSEYIVKSFNSENNLNAYDMQHFFINLIKLSLWGNWSDLFISAGKVNTQNHNPLATLETLNTKILIDDSEKIWKLIEKYNQRENELTIIDIVLDNAGYELFTDLCLAAFFIERKIADRVRFYVKRYPWFNSDVTSNDFNWIIKEMEKSYFENIKLFGQLCKKYLEKNLWTIEKESYWTEPYDYSEMKNADPALYNKLSEAILVIIKGELNYGKLLGDIKWKFTESFSDALREFKPTNLVSLRTVKTDICVGLSSAKAEFFEKNPNWNNADKFGTIQAFIKL